jgi:hypothetical protein
MIISLIVITYFIIAFIFGYLCYENFIGITDSAQILGLFWGIVLPFMIVYALLGTIVKWFKMCWE